jgi:Leucine-rich repeat (LRR) protein
MKLQNIILVSMLTLLSIELLPMQVLPRSVRDLLQDPNEHIQVVDGTLDLVNKGLTSLDGLTEIPGWENITRLFLAGNQLNTLPPEIGRLTRLQGLYLASNQLNALPAEIGRLTRLQDLDLSENQLTTLPAQIGRLTRLQELDLSTNLLSFLPVEIGRLTRLRELNLYHNQLSTLPVEIGYLASLEGLDLAANQLRTLPPQIGRLTRLEGLYLADNQLSTLPLEIDGLISLQELYLSGNRFSQTQVDGIRNYFQGRNIFLELSNQQIILEPNLTPQERTAFLAEEERAASLIEKEKTEPLTDQEKTELKQLQAEHECPICYGEVGGPMTAETTYKTVCPPKGHLFHKECLGSWVSRGTTSCPMCRRDIFTGEEAQRMPTAQPMEIGHNVSKPRKNQHLAQKSTHKKKSAVKIAKRIKKEKVAVA